MLENRAASFGSQILLPTISTSTSSRGSSSALLVALNLAHARELDGREVVDHLVQLGLEAEWEEDLEVHEEWGEDQGCVALFEGSCIR